MPSCEDRCFIFVPNFKLASRFRGPTFFRGGRPGGDRQSLKLAAA